MKGLVIFWSRFVGWVIFFIGVPIGFMAWRFELFSKVSQIKISGWGLVAIILVAVFLVSLLRYLTKSKEYSYLKQVLKGLMFPVIPLLAVWYMLNYFEDSIVQLEQFIGVLAISEAVAVIVNPMPKWVSEKTKGETEDIIEAFLTKREQLKK